MRTGIYSAPVPEYVITFKYSVQGRDYSGKYKARSPPELGQTFEIMYDPTSPGTNTVSYSVQTHRMKVLIWSLVIVLISWAWGRMKGH
jgi:hypothetical protein